MTFYDEADWALYRESIPIRITAPPKADRGPTAQWERAERTRLLWDMASTDEIPNEDNGIEGVAS